MNHSHRAEHVPPPPPPVPHRRDPSLILFIAAIVPLGMSIAAAVTSIWCQDPIIGRTAWIVVAVVGTATMVSAATCIKPPKPHRETDDETQKIN